MDVKEIVQGLLESTGIPTKYLIRPDIIVKKTVISFHFFNVSPDVFASGKIRKTRGQLQVDIWSTSGSPRALIETVKDLLIPYKFLFSGATETADEISGIRAYHIVLRFNFIESEVMRYGS